MRTTVLLAVVALVQILSCIASSLVLPVPGVEKQEIFSIPGWKYDLPSKWYAGYLHGSDSSRLFYIFVEAEEVAPATAPVTLWLNGGPGCSSLDGFWEELGPFSVKADGTLELRPFRWNRLSNMLFIEAPVGVGLSYSLTKNYKNDDDRTAIENSEALNHFFNLFPQFKANPFYLSGESYAGIYVPTLTEAILDRIKANNWAGPPIKGIAVGNGCTGSEIGICGMYEGNACDGLYYEYEFLKGLSFFNNNLRESIDAECDWNMCKNFQPNTTAPDGWAAKQNYTLTSNCIELLDDAFDLLGHINIYDVMGECDMRDFCEEPAQKAETQRRLAMEKEAFDKDFESLTEAHETVSTAAAAGRVGDLGVNSAGQRMTRLSQGLRKLREKSIAATQQNDPNAALDASSAVYGGSRELSRVRSSVVSDDAYGNEYFTAKNHTTGPAECIGSYNSGVWMNKNYASLGGIKNFCWGVCNRHPQWSYNTTRKNLPRDLYPRLVGNVAVMIYNGDVDACVPYTDNEGWTENMAFDVLEPWHPWAYTELNPETMYGSQVGGYAVEYDVSAVENDAGNKGTGKFSFRTIRGAGHMVPQTQPAAALEMFRGFIGSSKSVSLAPSPGPALVCEESVINDIIDTASSNTGTTVILLFMFIFMGTTACFYVKASYLHTPLSVYLAGKMADGSPHGNRATRQGDSDFDTQLDISDRTIRSGFETESPFDHAEGAPASNTNTGGGGGSSGRSVEMSRAISSSSTAGAFRSEGGGGGGKGKFKGRFEQISLNSDDL